jgi:hypothetical protein
MVEFNEDGSIKIIKRVDSEEDSALDNEEQELEYIQDLEELQKNIISYNKGLEEGSEHLLKTMSQVKWWYYSDSLDLFGPSKYIGYKGINPEIYATMHNHGMDGRDTQRVITKLLHGHVEEAGVHIYEELRQLLLKFGKEIHIKAKIMRIE